MEEEYEKEGKEVLVRIRSILGGDTVQPSTEHRMEKVESLQKFPHDKMGVLQVEWEEPVEG